MVMHMGYTEIRGEFADTDKTHRCSIEMYQKE